MPRTLLDPFQRRRAGFHQLFMERLVPRQIVGIGTQHIAGGAGHLGQKSLFAQRLHQMGAGAGVNAGPFRNDSQRDRLPAHIGDGHQNIQRPIDGLDHELITSCN